MKNTITLKKETIKDIFKDSFILNSKVEVENLYIGAKQYGGATQVNNTIYSNIDTNKEIELKRNNKYGIIVPTTLDINTVINNTEYVEDIKEKLNLISKNLYTIKSKGSWYSDILEDIVIEDSTIIYFNSYKDSSIVLKYMRTIALYLKEIMKQEGISIIVNDGLIII